MDIGITRVTTPAQLEQDQSKTKECCRRSLLKERIVNEIASDRVVQ